MVGAFARRVRFILNELGWCWWRPVFLSAGGGDLHQQIKMVGVEYQLLRNFLTYIAVLCDADKSVQMGSLVLDLEAALIEVMAKFWLAGPEQGYETALSKLQEKMVLFRPQIKESYDYVCKNLQSHFPLRDYDLWMEFAYCIVFNLKDLIKEKDELPTSVVRQLEILGENLKSLILFLERIEVSRVASNVKCKDLLISFGALNVRAAHLSYLCWVDKLDENMAQEMVTKLSDLQKKFKPNTPEVADMCLEVLKVSKKFRVCRTADVVCHIIDFLVPKKDQLETLRKGLTCLTTFLIDAPLFRRDVKLLCTDITEVVREVGSLSYAFHIYDMREDVVKKTNLALIKLLGKVELLKVEAFLFELLDQEARSTIIVKDRIDFIHEGLSFLRAFLGDASKGNRENSETIWTYIESVAKEAGSVYNLIHAKSVTEGIATDELFKLHKTIRLFKVETFLVELLEIPPNWMVNVKDQIETLCKGLMFLTTFHLGHHEENSKLILRRVESVASDVESFCRLFYGSKITEDSIRETNLLLPELEEKIKLIKEEIKETYLRIKSSIQFNYPRTNGLGFVDCFLQNMRELLNREVDAIFSVKQEIEVILIEMEEVLRSFPRDILEQPNQHSGLKNLGSQIINVAYEVEYLVDSSVVRGNVLWYHMMWLSDLVEQIKLIKIQASESSTMPSGYNVYNAAQTSRRFLSPASAPNIEDIVVDLDDEAEQIIDRLTRGSLQQDVVSIVGMPGLGKTTLAKKVYNDPSVTYHFHIHAWCCVTQVYRKRDLLLDILGDIIELTDNILEMSDEDLDFELYRCLKKRKFLIVMDDLWSIEAWNDLENSLPDDKNGSRILITSRLADVASKTKPDSIPHSLRLLSDDESWKLLQMKLFHTKECPDKLVEFGEQIAKSCKGLPLTVIAISGLLERTDKKQAWWKQVAESLSSLIADDPATRCMDILELSYKHLPGHLKQCFLYLGAFLEDKEIPVWKLTWLWIAEGFIQQTELESPEDAAEEYLMDLIGRSLVIASKRRSNGRVKTCRLHDMLRALCLMRCKEENFLQLINGYDELFAASYENLDYGVDSSSFDPTSSTTYDDHRLSICSKRNHFVMSRPSGPYTRSLLLFATSDLYPRCPYDISFISHNFKLLRVLDLECINMGNSFPTGFEFLFHLRYLALCGDIDSIPVSISNLWNLETLLVKGLKGKVLLPYTIWSMKRLRHLHVNNNASFSLQDSKMERSSQLQNLISLSSPSLFNGKDIENIMRRLPKLRKLRCLFSESRDDVGNSNQFPVLDFLTELETLKVLYSGRIAHPGKFDFPLTLKKLTLSKFRLPWDCISEIGRLPNLEVLKLLSRAFEGKIWNMKEGEFLNLKFLKLDSLNLAQWNASSEDLPKLERVVLRSCRQLQEVPSGFGDIPTLQMIEVQLCRRSAEESVIRIKEEQQEMGNEELMVHINRSDWDMRSSS